MLSSCTSPWVAALMVPLLLLRFWTISVPLSLTVIEPELLFIDTNVRVAPLSTSMAPVLPSRVWAVRSETTSKVTPEKLTLSDWIVQAVPVLSTVEV